MKQTRHWASKTWRRIRKLELEKNGGQIYWKQFWLEVKEKGEKVREKGVRFEKKNPNLWFWINKRDGKEGWRRGNGEQMKARREKEMEVLDVVRRRGGRRKTTNSTGDDWMRFWERHCYCLLFFLQIFFLDKS